MEISKSGDRSLGNVGKFERTAAKSQKIALQRRPEVKSNARSMSISLSHAAAC